MKYALRFVWYVLKIAIVVLSAFAILVAAFFVAMDSANVYVIVTDGMKARATSILMPDTDVTLDNYFTSGYVNNILATDRSQYANYSISDFDYKISVESLWCNPWKNTATVTIVESIPKFSYTGSSTDSDPDAAKKAIAAPTWQRARYRLSLTKTKDAWRISGIEKVENLLPEPTPTPEPSAYISASPLPSSASPGVSATPSPSPAATKK